jgi:hypothetical protein
MDSLQRQQRMMPLLSPDEVNPAPLDVFPTQPVIDAAGRATQQVSDEAAKMVQRAQIANQHNLFFPNELPKPDDQSRYEFAYNYQQATAGYTRWQAILDSTVPPTADEIKGELDKLQNQINQNRLVPDSSGNGYTAASQEEAKEEFDLESPSVEPRMELERAQQHRVYLLPNSLPIDPTITRLQVPTPEKICNAQLVMWILDDVAEAIARANESYSEPASAGGPPQHDILHSAVKQIEAVDLATGGPVISSNASDISAGKNSLVPKVPTVSPSGRVCNALYDVVRFRIRLIVDAAKVPQIIRELEVGQFITVLNVQFDEVIDPAVMGAGAGPGGGNQEGGFRFGNRPVIRIDLDCEELFMHAWTDSILPDSMKAGLGKGSMSPDNNGGGASGMAPGMMPPGGGFGPPQGGPYR